MAGMGGLVGGSALMMGCNSLLHHVLKKIGHDLPSFFYVHRWRKFPVKNSVWKFSIWIKIYGFVGIRKRSNVVWLWGLPFSASESDIAGFFKGLEMGPNGVVICVNFQGKILSCKFRTLLITICWYFDLLQDIMSMLKCLVHIQWLHEITDCWSSCRCLKSSWSSITECLNGLHETV